MCSSDLLARRGHKRPRSVTHAKAKAPPEPHKPRVQQEKFTGKQAEASLKRSAQKANAVFGVYGWADNYYFEAAAPNVAKEHEFPLRTQEARLRALLAEGRAPMAVGFFLAAGSLTPLNKVPAEENTERIASGLKPLLRPVNSGSAMAKGALGLLAKSPSGIKVRDSLQPHNLGIGAPSGTESIFHMMRSLYLKGWPVATIDVINGFNEILRQAILDAQDRKWPEGTAGISLFYGVVGMCFYVYTDPTTNEMFVTVIRGEEGARMGCKLGSLLFGITMDDVYKQLAEEFPEFVSPAHTNDNPTAFPPPEDNSREGWEKALRKYHSKLQR